MAAMICPQYFLRSGSWLVPHLLSFLLMPSTLVAHTSLLFFQKEIEIGDWGDLPMVTAKPGVKTQGHPLIAGLFWLLKLTGAIEQR